MTARVDTENPGVTITDDQVGTNHLMDDDTVVAYTVTFTEPFRRLMRQI